MVCGCYKLKVSYFTRTNYTYNGIKYINMRWVNNIIQLK